MARKARIVYPGHPHHVTQRGNRRLDVFFNNEDRFFYLELLKKYSAIYEVDILAYCLMTNHVHLVVVPTKIDSLQRLFKPLHSSYALRINKRKNWAGHLWQDRFFSSPLDEAHTWTAIGYVELNPVRAKMVKNAEDYPWSSAASRCKETNDGIITSDPTWANFLSTHQNWSAWLKSFDENPNEFARLRENTKKDLPLGAEGFVAKIERFSGRALRPRNKGRPRKNC